MRRIRRGHISLHPEEVLQASMENGRVLRMRTMVDRIKERSCLGEARHLGGVVGLEHVSTIMAHPGPCHRGIQCFKCGQIRHIARACL